VVKSDAVMFDVWDGVKGDVWHGIRYVMWSDIVVLVVREVRRAVWVVVVARGGVQDAIEEEL
jgi:hypothetical protein